MPLELGLVALGIKKLAAIMRHRLVQKKQRKLGVSTSAYGFLETMMP